MKWNILSAVIVVSCLAGNSQAAGLFSDDQGMHIPDQHLPVYFAYRAGTAPVDYPATAYDSHAAVSYQPISCNYHGIQGGGCADCAGLWSNYQRCKGHGHRGCGARCWGGHGLKAFGFMSGCKANGCGCSSPCGCNVYGYRSYAGVPKCGCGCDAAPKCGHGFGWKWKRACGLVAGCGCGCDAAPKCGHGFGWNWKRTCGLAGCGCDAAPKCGRPCGCKKGCGHGFKSFWSGMKRCCGVNSCGANSCGANSCGCAGNDYYNGEIVPEEMEDYAPTPESTKTAPGEPPAPPADARRGAGRTWQQASALFPSLPFPQN